ncbi:MAG: YhbY family RNA-binding protein [Candidatus Freyarchaeum deiterrae]
MEKRNSEIIKEIRSKSAALILGKNGVTEEFIGEVKRQLKRKKVLKIKVLKSLLVEKSVDEFASEVAAKSNSKLLETRGYTMLLARSRF